MVPPDVADEIRAQFPHVKMYEHEGVLLAGFAVEIDVCGHPERNGWVITGPADWPEVKDKALKWLATHSY